jgi:hypothetical protein
MDYIVSWQYSIVADSTSVYSFYFTHLLILFDLETKYEGEGGCKRLSRWQLKGSYISFLQ